MPKKNNLSRRHFLRAGLTATGGLVLATWQRTLAQTPPEQIYLPLMAANVAPAAPVTHGSQINAGNTGVPAGHTLTDVANSIVVTEAWISNVNGGRRFIENLNFLSGANLAVTVDGFTVQYCRFFGKGGFTNNANSGGLPLGKNISILDCEFDGHDENFGGDVAVYGSSLTLKRVHVHNWPRAMWVGDGDVWVEECYMHDLTCDGGDAHLENIYVAGGAHQTYLRSKFISNEIHMGGDSKMMTSACLAIYNESYERGAPYPAFPNLDDILVQDNYFESDGHYALYGGACVGKAAPYARNTIFRGNIFGRGLHRQSGVSGPAVCFDPSQPGNLWQNNTWGPRGAEWQAGDAEEGTLIDAPNPCVGYFANPTTIVADCIVKNTTAQEPCPVIFLGCCRNLLTNGVNR